MKTKDIFALLETILKKGFIIEIDMGDDKIVGVIATHPSGERMGSTGETIIEAVTRLANLIERH